MASRPEDPVAAAAKVIRIIHGNHAAQSRYLHALKVTPGESHPETKAILQCMEQEEYLDVLTDLDPPQKATFFDKVANVSEPLSESPSDLDKDTTKLYFEALNLKAKGLSFKDVRAEVKKRPVVAASAPAESTTAPTLPSTPPNPKPYREMDIKVKELNSKDKPAQEAVKPNPVAQKPPTAPAPQSQKEKKDNKDKKRKREDDTPKVSKKTKTEPEVPVGGSQKRQKRREKQKMLLEKVAAGEIPVVSKPAAKETSETEKTPAVAPSSASKEQLPVNKDVQPNNTESAPLESTVQTAPKTKKVRRSRHKSEKMKSKPVEPEQPIQPSAAEPPIVSETENTAPTEGNKKARSRRARKAKAAAFSVTTSAPVAEPVPIEEPALVEEPALIEDGSPSSSDEDDEDDENENQSTKEYVMSDFVRRTALPMLGKPTISAIADPSSDKENEQGIASPTSEHMETIKPEIATAKPVESSISEVNEELPVQDMTQKESSSEAIHEESPSPTTRETSVSSNEEVPSPVHQLQQKSSPMLSKTELPKPVTSSFTSAPSQPAFSKPRVINSFSKPQSSFTSTRSGSVPNSDNKKSVTDSFAEFAAFAAGKKLGYDSSDDDDDSSSSSSSSDSDDEKPAPVQARKPSPVRRQPSPAPSISPVAEPEASAMDVDTETGDAQEKTDAISAPIDVVMTDDQQNTSSLTDHNNTNTSDQEREAEQVAEEVKDEGLVGFQSFHESTVPHDAPSAQSPLADIPSPEDLMEFGGYQPSTTETTDQVTLVFAEDQQQTSEPANREDHENPELTEPLNSTGLDVVPQIDDKVSNDTSEVGEQASVSSEHEQIPEAARESSELGDKDAENQNIVQSANSSTEAKELAEDEKVPDTQVLDLSQSQEIETAGLDQASGPEPELEEPAEAFSQSMKDFLAAWEEETNEFENRIQELRRLLVEDGNGSAEDNKDILEKLMNEVDREEKLYKAKTTTARNGLVGLERLARIKILEVLDRADASFEQRLIIVKSTLREEHNSESARSQLAPDGDAEDSDVEMKDESDIEAEAGAENNDQEVESSAKSNSPAPSSLGWAPSEDEGLTESAKKEQKVKTRKPRKSTGTTSEHFTPSPKRKRVPAGASAVPFPKLSEPRFGLIQERLANDPFRLLIAVTFLNKTHGRAARPIFEQVMETYPTPQDLAAANVSELSEMIHSLGFQNQRARKLIKIAETWVGQPPQKGKLYRTMDYPNKGNGRHLKPKETVDEDVEDCIQAGALEVAHIYGLGPYAWDSWRIFCRDKFRGVAEGYNGEGVPGYKPSSQAKEDANFEPEWKRVVPLDKELRACLRWMWLREGWEWDPLTGNKKKAAPTLMREASDGVATWEEPVALNPHDEDTTTIKEELAGPKGPAALVPGVKVEDVEPAPKRRTRRGRNSAGAIAKRAAFTTPPPAVPKQAATPAVPASSKRLNADPEIMTSRLRPRAGRADAVAFASAPVPATPSRRRAARK